MRDALSMRAVDGVSDKCMSGTDSIRFDLCLAERKFARSAHSAAHDAPPSLLLSAAPYFDYYYRPVISTT